jgi:hypothetical protein
MPQFVAGCLAKPESERAACFMSSAGSAPTVSAPSLPDPVAACLAMPVDRQEACFFSGG